MPEITVVITTHNKAESLKVVLWSLSLYAEPLRVIVCCDGGDGESTERVVDEAAKHLNCELLYAAKPGQTPQGAGNSRNVGIFAATTERVLIIDDDCLCLPKVIQIHAGVTKNMGLIGLRRHIKQSDWRAHFLPYCFQSDKIEALYDASSYVHVEDIRTIKGQEKELLSLNGTNHNTFHLNAWTCHVSYPVAAVKEIGGFNPRFVGSGCEDGELALRLQRYGVDMHFIASPPVYHLDHPVSPLQSDNYPYNRKIYDNTRKNASIVKI